jgi:3-phosphoshikimate 1-carboxyvinyltransferase
MFGSIAEGITEIEGFLQGADCLSTIGCFRSMGIEIDNTPEKIIIHGKGLRGLSAPSDWLDVGNSGTTTRLISGILCGQNFESRLSGDESLNSRPMKRIMDPLRQMGGNIESINGNDCAPLHIAPGSLHGIHYHSKVASAQVKSCALLAGLYAKGETQVTEPVLSRNHTELMLKGFGADVSARMDPNSTAATAIIQPCTELYGQKITVPGDISSATYFIAAGLLVPNSEILIKNVGINPTRAGILQVCKDMGGDISYVNERTVSGEPVADILVKSSSLHGTTVEGSIIPTLIDEIPMIAVLAAFADGTTTIRDAAELKVKETNRIETVTHNLKAMGGDITPTDDGMIIRGGKPLHGAELESFLDHRIAMAFAIGALAADGTSTILRSTCVDVSYPDFFQTLEKLQK